MRPWPLAVLGLAVVLCAPALSEGQLETMMSPELGKVMPRAEYRFSFWPERPVVGQSTDFSVTQHRVSFTTPLVQDARDEWSFGGRVRLDEFDTHAHLPDSGGRLPTELWDIRLEPGYRHRFDNGWVAGGTVSLGSASDEPFASENELVVRALGFLRVPQGERNAWLFLLTYSNVSDVLGVGPIPVPGLAYVYSPSDKFTAVIGAPFASLHVQPTEDLSLDLAYILIRDVHARATYRVFAPLRVWVAFDWDYDVYLRAGRRDADQRLFYYDKRVTAGVRFDLRHVGVEVVGGYSLDRFFFEGQDYSDRDHNRIDIKDGPFVSARLSVRF
jgi:hypothetical protein